MTCEILTHSKNLADLKKHWDPQKADKDDSDSG